MNLNLTNATFVSKPTIMSFCAGNYSQENKDCENKIKEVLEVIQKNDNLFADIGTISKLSGYPAEVVYYCLNNSDNKELYILWQETIHKAIEAEEARIIPASTTAQEIDIQPQEQPKKSTYNHPKSVFVSLPREGNVTQQCSDAHKKELEKIESAMKEILNNPNIEAEIENIAKITGLSVRTVSSKIYAPDSTLYNLWQYVESVKEDDTPERRRRLAKFYRIKDESVLTIKPKNSGLALKMLKQAVASGSRISYREIERASGLNKAEIDELIVSYAKTKQEQARLAQENKKLQAQWYENNYSVS